MTLGFLGKLFGKKVDEEEEEPLVLSLDEVRPWLERRVEEAERDAVERLGPLVEEIQDSRDAAKEIVLDIKEYEFPQDIKKRVYKPVLTSKPTYVKTMLDGLGAIDSREARSFEDLEEFHKAVLNVMKVIQKTQLGKGRYMTIAFRDEMLKIGATLNSIIDSLNTLGDALNEEREELDRIRRAVSMVDGLINKIEAVRTADRDIDGEIKALMEKRKVVEGSLRGLLKSREYGEWERALEKLENVREEKANHRSRIINSIGPFARVFRKYKKLIEDGGAKGDARILEGYLQNPVGTFTREDSGCGRIKSLLNGIRESVENGTLQLDEKEGNKVLAKIKMELGLIGKLRSEIDELRREEKDLQRALSHSRVGEQKDALEEELRALETDIKKLENEKTNAAAEEERLRAEVEKLADKIREELEEMEGKTVRVELPAF